MSSNNKTSYLISSQVPEFVRQDHPNFVQFMEAYYRFLEQEGEIGYVSKNFSEYLDPDIIEADLQEHIEGGITNSQYAVILEKYYDNFMKFIPRKVIADKNVLLKHIQDFYRSRGTEKSVKFLLRIMFDKEATFYYPKRDILKTSDGKWFIEKSLKITNLQVNNVSNSIGYTNFINHTIRGAVSNATAIVENVDVYFDKGQEITELKISNVVDDFESGEQVFAYFTEQGVDKRISANLFSGIVVSAKIANAGIGYTVGTYIPIESNTGSGAQIVITKTSQGGLKALALGYGGAGFQVNSNILITGGGGTGANGYVSSVNTSGSLHPNSYNIVASTISLESNTTIGNVTYTNLSSTNANVSMANAFTYWVYGNCGPISFVSIYNQGNNYTTIPSLDVIANTGVRSLSIIGRLEIVDGGQNYQKGDLIEFINTTGSYGVGALANVANVDSANSNAISEVHFISMTGHQIGGSGYNASLLPTANVISATGNGANIVVKALIADNEQILTVADTIGAIREVTIVSGGNGYETIPYANLSTFGSGTAQVDLSIVTGVYKYPGRFINDDGHVSSYNFIQNRDYYQNYSYVIRINESINKYRKAVRDLIHPGGMKFYGQYMFLDEDQKTLQNGMSLISTSEPYLANNVTGTYRSNTVTISVANTNNVAITNGVVTQVESYSNYSVNVSNITVNYASHGLIANDVVELQFTSGDTANIENGYFVVLTSNTNTFFVHHSNLSNTSGSVIVNLI